MELDLWKVIVLAIVQGITEFLPISSDGHLAIVTPLLCGGETPEGMLGVTIMLHMGTLLSILVFYHRRIVRLFGGDRHVALAIVIATIPAVLIGLPLKKYGEWFLADPTLAGAMLFVTGAALLFIQRCPPGNIEYQQIPPSRAWWIGCFQALAILPGISRSGMTISSGVGFGLTRPSAATFSFLMAIPAIAGAGVLEAKDAFRGESLNLPVLHIVVGTIVSFFVGLVALWWLNRWLERGKLHYFAWYCFALGAAVLAWQLGR